MNHLSCISTILVLITLLIPLGECRILQPNNVGLITSTCNKTPNPILCIQLIDADPRSSTTAEVVGSLAVIMVDVIKARATDALIKINQLLKGGSGDKNALSECNQRYNAILLADVPQAMIALKTGNPKFAESAAGDAGLEATSCEQKFSGQSPLTNENNGMHDVADFTTAIVRILL